MTPLSEVEFQLLALIEPREKSGREIAAEFSKETGKAISWGTLYTTFRRLREAGMVKVRDAEDEDGRLRYFILLGSGLRALREQRGAYEKLAIFAQPGRAITL